MFKRVTWFTVGAVVGAGGTVVGYLRARDVARRHLPADLQDAAGRVADAAVDEAKVLAAQARRVGGQARDRLDGWRDAADEGRTVRDEAERRLRAELQRAGL